MFSSYYLCKLFVQSYVLKAYQLLKLILFYYNTLLITSLIMYVLITCSTISHLKYNRITIHTYIHPYIYVYVCVYIFVHEYACMCVNVHKCKVKFAQQLNSTTQNHWWVRN